MIGGARRIAVVASAFSLAAAPAQAAEETVHTTPSNTWDPASVTINVGDTVTWVNRGGFHNVKFDDGFEQPSEPSPTWTSNPRRTFTAAGSYRYFCEQHQSTMIGRVVVQDTSQPPPGGEPPDTTPPDIDDLKLVPSTFCNRKTKSCPKVGTEIRFTVDEDATITGRIYRRSDGRRVGKLRINATEGANAWPFSGKGLALGKYRLELTPKDAAGNKPSKPSRASFRIASKR